MPLSKFFHHIFFVLAALAFAPTLVRSQSKPPTQKELDAMMKEAQKMMNNLDPESKRMMDSMGIKMPTLKAAPQVGDKALAKAWEDDMRLVPVKDVNRIKAIPATPTAENVSAYLKKIQTALDNTIDPAKKAETEKIFTEVSATSAASLDVAAIGLWIGGMPLEAIYFLLKALDKNADDADALNNYASMLTLAGAEQLAIPILQLLNQQYPSNSTILNNLGQAWLGLGDLALSEKYLDSAINIFPMHSQANLAKAAIAKSKGNTTAAAEAIAKSAATAYSADKEKK